jgi:hypothetical protein
MKQLVDADVRASWAQRASHARYVLRRKSVPFIIADARFVTFADLGDVEQELRDEQKAFFEARDALIQRYGAIRREMLARSAAHRKALEEQYPPRDVVHDMFYFDWTPMTVGIPKNLSRKTAAPTRAAGRDGVHHRTMPHRARKPAA